MSRRRRLFRIIIGLSIVVVAVLIYAAWPGSSTYTISPETTYVTGPLEKDDHIDYVTALNERLRGDITPETNANVLIWQALGPRPEQDEMPPEYFTWLGIERPPDSGEYFIPWPRYLRDHSDVDLDEREDEYLALPGRHRRGIWTAAEQPELARWLQRNAKPLSHIIEATKRTKYFNPLVPSRTESRSSGLLDARLPTLQRCREVAETLMCRSMLKASAGDFEDAWSDLFAAHRLGALIARGGTQIECLVGFAIEATLNNSYPAFLEAANLDSKRFLRCQHELLNLGPVAQNAAILEVADRIMMLDTLTQVIRSGPDHLAEMGKSTVLV